MSSIFSMLAEHNVQVNVMQNSAISFSFCANYDDRKFDALMPKLSELFNMEVFRDLTLITLHNYKSKELPEILLGKKVYIEQHSKNVVQYVYE